MGTRRNFYMTIKSMSLHEFYEIDADKFAENLEQLASLEHLDTAEDVETIHGHHGKTKVIYTNEG